MNQIKPWLTVREAAFILSKDQSRIYIWIRDRGLEARTNEAGVVEVSHLALMRMESETTRGRPRHTTSSA